MAHFEDLPSTNKRKASPSPPPSNAPAKRSRVDLDEPDHYEDTRGGHRKDSTGYGSRSRSPIQRRQSFPRKDSYGRDRQPPFQSPQEPLAPPPRKSVTQEERKRGQRLFGGILGTLSGQTGPSNSLHKRRLDIERRQHDRAQKQEVEDEKRRKERAERTRRERMISQIEVDEKIMHTRHENLMAAARSLTTRSYPRICYRPWRLTREQARTIRDQIRNAEDRIDRELADWKRERERRYRELGALVPAPTRSKEGDGRDRDRQRGPGLVSNDEGADDNRGEQDSCEFKDAHMVDDGHNKKEGQVEEKDKDGKRRNSDQHHDEVMVQDAEDTVIY